MQHHRFTHLDQIPYSVLGPGFAAPEDSATQPWMSTKDIESSWMFFVQRAVGSKRYSHELEILNLVARVLTKAGRIAGLLYVYDTSGRFLDKVYWRVPALEGKKGYRNVYPLGPKEEMPGETIAKALAATNFYGFPAIETPPDMPGKP